MFKSSHYLVLAFKLWAVPSNKTLISFICTCNGVIPNLWGHKAKHGKQSSRPAQALFSPLFPFGCGVGTSSSYPQHTQAGSLPCFIKKEPKQQNQLPSPPASPWLAVSLLMQHLHQHHPIALAPRLTSPTPAVHGHHPSPGFREVTP